MNFNKTNFCLSIGFAVLAACNNSGASVEEKKETATDTLKAVKPEPRESIAAKDLLSLPDAEKILGEPAHLKDSATTVKKNAVNYSCAYIANAKDKKTGKTGAIYLLFEHYFADSAASNRYTFIKKANEDHGIKTLEGIGDEAYFHSDNQNFYFIMVRKGPKVFNMKVNKLTSTTSLEEFNRIAKQIAGSL